MSFAGRFRCTLRRFKPHPAGPPRLAVLAAAILILAAIPAAAAEDALPPGDLSGDPEARGFAEMMFGRGRLAWEDGRAEEALGLFDRAAATWPRDATYTFFAGLVELRLGRPGAAAAKIARALPPADSRIPEWRVRADLGTALYRDGRAAEAESHLRRALELQPGDAPARFTLGLVLLDLGRNDEAAAEMRRAAGEDPSLGPDADYYAGVAAMRAGEAGEARGRFEKVVAASGREGAGADPLLVEGARGWLAVGAAGPPGRAPLGEIRVGLAWERDDNPALVSDDPGIAELPPDTPGSDNRLAAALRAEWRPVFDWHGLSASLLLNAYWNRYDDLEAVDQLTPQGLVQLAWGRDAKGYVNGPLGFVRVPAGRTPVAFVFQGGSSYTWLDGDSWARSHTAAAGLNVPWCPHSWTQADVIWEDRKLFGDLAGRSLDALTGRLSQYVAFGRPERYLRVGYGLTDEDADGTQIFDFDVGDFVTERRAYDNEQKVWFGELALPLPKGLALFLEGSRGKTDYDVEFPIEPFFDAPREDTQKDFSATLVVPVGGHLYFTGRFARLERDSDLDFYDYTRKVTSFGVTWYW